MKLESVPSLYVAEIEPSSSEFDEVLRLYRQSKGTLGFLPDGGFEDRASRGSLLAALDGAAVVGYVLYDLPTDGVKLRHLCVSSDSRGRGVARRLVDELISRHQDRRAIELACRRDYGLDGMWKALGFHPVHNRRGRSLAGHLLTVWQIDFGHPTLFSSAPVTGDLACLDQSVLEDVILNQQAWPGTRYLLEDWVDELVEFCVTDEVFMESNDTPQDSLRQSLLEGARNYRNLSRQGAPWEQHLNDVAACVPRAGDGDHRHLARAIEGGATYFVTCDDRVLAGATAAERRFGLIVVTPESLLDRLDRQRSQDRYEPVVLQGTDLTEERVPGGDEDDFVAALLNHGEGEKSHLLKRALRTALADTAHSEVRAVRGSAGGILGGVIRTTEQDALVVHRLRVGRADRVTDAVARQLVFGQRLFAADHGLSRVVLADPKPSPAVLRALDAEGFDGERGHWQCVVRRGVYSAEAAALPVSDRATAAAFERRQWPTKVTGAGLPTFMISIEPAYAEQLFDTNLVAATLFPRSLTLGLSREHVYYRAPSHAKLLTGPARLIWYVKGGKPGHQVGHVRAVSHLLEVAIDRPRTLYGRFARLGVWNQAQVEEAARRTGEAMALRLTDTELLDRPLALQELRSIYEDAGERFHAPQAPVLVPEHMFCLLYCRSSRYA